MGEILLPRAFIGDHLAVVAFDPVFLRFALNSLIVATGTTIVSITVATLGAYSLARLRFPGSESIGRFVLLTYTVPSVLLLIPLFKIVVTLNLANNLIALVITYTTFSVPFCVWLLRSYFQSLPRDLEEAAMVDGASRLGALFRVILPLSVPGIVATALFAFILAWNEFLFALVFTTTSDVKTLPIGVSTTFTAEQNGHRLGGGDVGVDAVGGADIHHRVDLAARAGAGNNRRRRQGMTPVMLRTNIRMRA